jgi:hypothetical protein
LLIGSLSAYYWWAEGFAICTKPEFDREFERKRAHKRNPFGSNVDELARSRRRWRRYGIAMTVVAVVLLALRLFR